VRLEIGSLVECIIEVCMLSFVFNLGLRYKLIMVIFC